VTIAIGFISHAGIIMASDSQSSDFVTTHMRSDETKICGIPLSNGGKAMIAKAGTIETADYFLEIFQNNALATKITHSRSVADIAEKSMIETRSKLLANFKHDSLPTDSYLKHLEDYSCKVLLGYKYNDTPLLYTLTSDSCWAIKSVRPFEALGCGAGIASYLLTGFDLPRLEAAESIGLAAYAVQMCKNHDIGCGGRIQSGFIYGFNGTSCSLIEPGISEIFEDAAKKAESEMLKPISEVILKNMKKMGLFEDDPKKE
jgi:hypothetical protein